MVLGRMGAEREVVEVLWQIKAVFHSLVGIFRLARQAGVGLAGFPALRLLLPLRGLRARVVMTRSRRRGLISRLKGDLRVKACSWSDQRTRV